MYSCYGQSNEVTYKQDLSWFTYSLNWKINNKYNSVTEFFDRIFLKPVEKNQLGARTVVRRKFAENWNAGVGGAYFLNSPNVPGGSNTVTFPEIRPQLEVNYGKKVRIGSFNNRFLFETRFFHVINKNELGNGYQFNNFRFRYQLTYNFRLVKDKINNKTRLSLKLQDEIMANITNEKATNLFDQNRLYAALNYSILEAIDLEVGCAKIYQTQLVGDNSFDRNVIRFSIFHRIE
jgi:Protein of unknown function (DUF2490)